MKKKQSHRRQSPGFTMIEVMIASLLMTMILAAAFPMFRTGKGIADQKQRTMEIEILGDSVFERAEKELQNTMSLDGWDKADTRLERYGLDMEVLAEPMEEGWHVLRVELSDDESVQYIREEWILVPNYGKRKAV